MIFPSFIPEAKCILHYTAALCTQAVKQNGLSEREREERKRQKIDGALWSYCLAQYAWLQATYSCPIVE